MGCPGSVETWVPKPAVCFPYFILSHSHVCVSMCVLVRVAPPSWSLHGSQFCFGNDQPFFLRMWRLQSMFLFLAGFPVFGQGSLFLGAQFLRLQMGSWHEDSNVSVSSWGPGHTCEAKELGLGFAVTGTLEPRREKIRGLRKLVNVRTGDTSNHSFQ